jgi:hypothetical protein
MSRSTVPYRAALWIAALLSAVLAPACDSVGGEVVPDPAGSRGVRVFVKNDSRARFTLEGKAVPVGETGFHAVHATPDAARSSFGIARGGREVARVSYRILRFPDGAQDTKIIVTESGAAGFLARTTDSKWIEVLDVQLF